MSNDKMCLTERFVDILHNQHDGFIQIRALATADKTSEIRKTYRIHVLSAFNSDAFNVNAMLSTFVTALSSKDGSKNEFGYDIDTMNAVIIINEASEKTKKMTPPPPPA